MSICSCYFDDPEFFYEKIGEPKPFNLKRRKRCINCKKLINQGTECQELDIWRYNENGDEKHSASRWLCEKCSDLSMSLDELNACYSLGGDLTMEQQIRQSNDEN
jgi:hypothetical protein